MRILKKCKKKSCRQEFSAVYGDNLKKDKKGSFHAICPWCNHKNKLTKLEINTFLLETI